jgi:hypothetical protein
MTETNPLIKHFRQPVLYIQLNSKGRFWNEGALELTTTSELPILPMTAKDEIILRTPDALLNGTSVVQVIESCCPLIKDAWQAPSIDIDSLLIAIRIASLGNNMTITARCPHCNNENDYEINLQNMLSKIKNPDYDTPVIINDEIKVTLQPLTYLQVSKASLSLFEQDKMMQSLSDVTDDEQRKLVYNNNLNKMIELNINNLVNSTRFIELNKEKITNKEHIAEYYKNAETKVIRKIQQRLEDIASQVNIKEQETQCSELDCKKKFKLNIEFDYAHFFAKGF